jgi:hypothetical protein
MENNVNVRMRLADIFDRGLSSGVDSLSPLDRELFRIQDFIIDQEMSSLSGYIYNKLPNLNEIRAAVDAMRKHGLPQLAALVKEAADLFAEYSDPDPPTTWDEVCRRYDPKDRLSDLNTSIDRLDNYGLDQASIVEEG